MKRIYILLVVIIWSSDLSAQSVGIGTLTPDSSAILDLSSDGKGILIPRMSTTQRNEIHDPAIGLQILNLDDYCTDTYDGLHWIKNCGMRSIEVDTLGADWVKRTDLGGAGRHGAVGMAIGGKGYVGTGTVVNQNTKDWWEYDPEANNWTQKADLAGEGRSYAMSFIIGDKGYIGTGYSNTSLNDFWEYNPSTNGWTQILSLPASGRSGASGFVLNGKGYIIGGSYSGQTFQDVWYFDPVLNTWTATTDFPYPVSVAVGFAIGSKGYIGTGVLDYNLGIDTDEFYSFDPVGSTWTPLAPFGGGERTSAVGFSDGSKGYIGTGEGGGFENDFWSYDPLTDTWTMLANFEGQARQSAVGFFVGGKGYIGTGFPSRKDFWMYNPPFIGNTYQIALPEENPYSIVDGIWTKKGEDIYPTHYTHLYNAGNIITSGSGKIGIGTASPNAELQFSNGLSNRKLVLFESGNNEHQFYGFGINPNTLRYQVDNSQSDHVFYAALAGNSSRELLRIRGNGNVGIGVTEPVNKLDVNSFWPPRDGLHPVDLPLYVTGNFNSSANMIEFRHYDGTKGVGFGNNTINATGTNPSQHLSLAAKGTEGHLLFNTNSTEKMRITSTGNVGIGSTNPEATMDIARGIGPEGTIRIKGTSHHSHFNYSTAESTFIRGGKPGSHVILNDLAGLGNIGIGTNNPIQKLHVAGKAYVRDSIGIGVTTPNAPIQLSSTIGNRKIVLYELVNNDHQFLGFGINPSVLRYQTSTTTTDHVFYAGTSATTSDELMRIKGNGDVGIGIAPTNQVDVQTGSSRTGTHPTGIPMYVTGDIGAASSGVEVRHNNAAEGIGLGYNTIYAAGNNASQNLGLSAKGSAGHLLLTTNGVERFRINASGNIGIGTVSPNAPLQFSNATGNRKIVLYEVGNDDHQFFGFGVNASGTLRYQTPITANDHVFYAGTSATTSNELMRVRGSGNVDISGALEIGYQIVESAEVNVPGLSAVTMYCDCPPGHVVLGGGYWSNFANACEVGQDRPLDSNTWVTTYYNTSVNAHLAKNYAICARLGN